MNYSPQLNSDFEKHKNAKKLKNLFLGNFFVGGLIPLFHMKSIIMNKKYNNWRLFSTFWQV